jgi:hypothetical protein
MLASIADETMSAFIALKKWNRSQTISAHSFLDDVGSLAGRTRRVVLIGE